MRRAVTLIALSCFALPAVASAAKDPAITARNIIPSGQPGAVPPPAGADRQALMYDALTPLFDNVTNADLRRDFKSEAFNRIGTDGPGKAEIAVDELLRARVVCDEWEQASHNGEIARALDHGLKREDVAELGRVLAGDEEGRRDEHEITLFDSTGLAVQDLAVALAVYEAWRANPEADSFVGVTEITA